MTFLVKSANVEAAVAAEPNRNSDNVSADRLPGFNFSFNDVKSFLPRFDGTWVHVLRNTVTPIIGLIFKTSFLQRNAYGDVPKNSEWRSHHNLVPFKGDVAVNRFPPKFTCLLDKQRINQWNCIPLLFPNQKLELRGRWLMVIIINHVIYDLKDSAQIILFWCPKY